MQTSSKTHCLSRIFNVMTFSIIFCTCFLKFGTVAHAGVRATDINVYLNSNGDAYSVGTKTEKEGYGIAKTAAVNDSGDVRWFTSEEEYYGYEFYTYDHPAIANNYRFISKSQAANTLLAATRLANRAEGTTKYEQALSLHDLLCDAIDYGCAGGAWNGQSAYEALIQGQAVCHGYAEAYKLLCDLKGIPCHIAYGHAGSERHAWNVVQLDDGQWYEVDPTWDDQSYGTIHNYFAKTTQAFSKDHERVVLHNERIDSLAPVASGTTYEYIPITDLSIELNETYWTVTVGESMTLKAITKPDNATEKNVKWSSEDTSIATVDENGKVTGVKAGSTYITVMSERKGYSVPITVKKATVIALSFNKTLVSGSTADLLTDMEPYSTYYKTLTWTTSNDTIASVDSSGVVTAKNPGMATVKATSKGSVNVEGTFSILVKTVPVKTITISGPEKIKVNENATLAAGILPGNATNKSVTWSSSDEQIAYVNPESGIIQGHKAGKAVIKAEAKDSSGVSATFSIEVISPVTKIAITGPVTVDKGKTISLTATVSPEDAYDKTVKWEVSDSKILSVDKNGTVKGLAAGKATVTVTSVADAVSSSVQITVKEPEVIKEVVKNDESKTKDKTETTNRTEDTKNNTAKTTTETKATNDTQAKQPEKTGATTPVTTTTSDSAASKDNNQDTKKEADDNNNIAAAGESKPAVAKTPQLKITVAGEKVVRVGSSIKLSATTSKKTGKLKWVSSNSKVATVNSAGKVTGKKAGTVTIKAYATDGSGAFSSLKIKVIKKGANLPASKLVKKTASVKGTAKGNKKVKISWKKQSGSIRYEVQVATDKSFKKNLVTKTITANGLNLKYKKTGTAYIRVRAIDKNGYAGTWSDAKKVKIK